MEHYLCSPLREGPHTGVFTEIMVFIKMVAHFTLRTYDVNKVFSEKQMGFDDSFDVTKCLQQFEMLDLLNVCA